MTHSFFSPSASTRWLNCPGSLFLKQEAPKSNPNQIKGTIIHRFIHNLFIKFITECGGLNDFNTVSIDIINEIITAESQFEKESTKDLIIDNLIMLCDYWVAIQSLKLDRIKIEKKHNLDVVIQGCFGTPDVVGLSGDKLYVIDLKTGLIPVSPYENFQLYLYSLNRVNSEDVTLVIFQNSLKLYKISNHFRDSMDYLIDKFNVDILTEKKTLKTGEHCLWCPARKNCPLVISSIAKLKAEKEIGVLHVSLDKLESLYDDCVSVTKFMAFLKQELEFRIIKRQETGSLYEAIIKKGRRSIIDETVIAYATKNNLKDVLLATKSQPLSVLKKYISAELLEEMTKSEPSTHLERKKYV